MQSISYLSHLHQLRKHMCSTIISQQIIIFIAFQWNAVHSGNLHVIHMYACIYEHPSVWSRKMDGNKMLALEVPFFQHTHVDKRSSATNFQPNHQCQ